jgi:hypothetical protein
MRVSTVVKIDKKERTSALGLLSIDGRANDQTNITGILTIAERMYRAPTT